MCLIHSMHKRMCTYLGVCSCTSYAPDMFCRLHYVDIIKDVITDESRFLSIHCSSTDALASRLHVFVYIDVNWLIFPSLLLNMPDNSRAVACLRQALLPDEVTLVCSFSLKLWLNSENSSALCVQTVKKLYCW